MEKFGAFTYTRSVLAEIDKEVREEIAKLGDNPLMTSLLDELFSWNNLNVNRNNYNYNSNNNNNDFVV